MKNSIFLPVKEIFSLLALDYRSHGGTLGVRFRPHVGGPTNMVKLNMNAPSDERGNAGAKPNQLTLIVIVNGVAANVETNPNAALASVIAEALRETKNTGQPPDNWILTTEDGRKLEPHDKPAALGLANGTKLFLNLKAGVGGDC